MKVAIVNYGVGNLASVERAFEDIGADIFVANHPSELYVANRIVLPGVGSFAESMESLVSTGWSATLDEVVVEQGKPLLGICLGMQMLASFGLEGGGSKGLGYIPGTVKRLDAIGCKFRIPHVGWNDISYLKAGPLFDGIQNFSDFYFI
jgi:glutamine amidotransferase